MVYLLDDELWFPDPHCGDSDGLFAVGGDLRPERLLLAYSNGIFPWYAFRKEDNEYAPDDFKKPDGTPLIRWYCPLQRFVIFPKEIHISHSMRQMIRKNEHSVTINQAFDDVIANCSKLRIEEEGAWLGPDIIEAYTRLHREEACASVEVWNKNHELVGGLYGVLIGKSFIGESMFSLTPSASKLALIGLAQFMESWGGTMIDCQLETPHLKSMGGRFISYEEYIKLLKDC